MKASKKCILCGFDLVKMLYQPLRIVKCEKCGFISRDVIGIEDDYYHELDKYRQSLQDTIKMTARKRDAQLRFDIIEKVVKSRGSLLDIGANDGLSMLEAEVRGFKTLGCEPNIYAAQYATKMGLEIINKSFVDAFDELIKRGPFNVVTIFHVLEHFPDPLKLLRMVRELMSLDSYLIVEVPDIDSPISKIYKWDDLRINKEHLFYFNKNSLNTLVRKAGFRIFFAKRKVWNGLNQSFINNTIRFPFLSESYMFLRKFKNYVKKIFNLKKVPRHTFEDNVELWVKGKAVYKRYRFSCFLGKLVYLLNRGDDLFLIGKKHET
jgi:hypothetical protein